MAGEPELVNPYYWFCEIGLKRIEPVAPVLNSVFENRTGSKLYHRVSYVTQNFISDNCVPQNFALCYTRL